MTRQSSAWETREDVYRALLSRVVLTRIPVARERGVSFAYHPSLAVVRPQIADPRIAAEGRAFGMHMADLFGVDEPIRSRIPRDMEVETYAEELDALFDASGASTLMYEGYAIDLTEERADLMQALARRFGSCIEVINPPPDVAVRWNDKHFFRGHVAARLGAHAVAPGIRTEEFEFEKIAPLIAAHIEQSPVGRAIVKIAGAGGLGNMVFARSDSSEECARKYAALQGSPVWKFAKSAVVEAWIPWEETLCCSYFVTNAGVLIPMEMCSQVISEKTAGFMGGTSCIQVSPSEQRDIRRHLYPIAQAMVEDGVRGFFAMDVIVCSSGGLPLSSGRSIRLIEANMRINGHNQERLFAYRVAARDGLPYHAVDHVRLGAYAPGMPDMETAHYAFQGVLDGVARPFSHKPMEVGSVYYVVLDNHGGAPSIYDSVLFFGHGLDRSARPFDGARGALRTAGFLRE